MEPRCQIWQLIDLPGFNIFGKPQPQTDSSTTLAKLCARRMFYGSMSLARDKARNFDSGVYPRFHSTVEVKILKFFKTASLVIATVTLSGMPIASAAAAPDSSRTPSLPIVSQTNDSGLIAEAEKEAGKANGAPSYAAQSTPRGEVEIAVTSASFLQQEDGTVAVVADSGERVETLPKEYTFEDGEVYQAHYTILDGNKLLVQFTSDNPNLQDWQCYTDNVAVGFATGVLGGCVMGGMCGPGGIAGTIVGLGNGILNC